jgi:rhamnulokinase
MSSAITSRFIALDLGAESGRAILGSLAAGRLELNDLHRFPHTPLRLPSGLYWNSLGLFEEMLTGLRLAARQAASLDGIAVDTWGVDFGLVQADGSLADNPRCYRDARTQGLLDAAFQLMPRDQIFASTGIQFMEINSLYQLLAARISGLPALDSADRLLFMPDLFHRWLCGAAVNERTIASTSQMFNPRTSDWAWDVIDRLELPRRLLGPIVDPGVQIGSLLPHVAADTGLPAVPVFTTGCHDTASAVAAVPATGDDWCYISSGTWSLMGVELPAPVINEHTLRVNYTNEAGVAGTTRLLKNIAGLWPLQECRRAWARQGQEFTYEQLTHMAAEAGPAPGLVDPDEFLTPGDMPRRIGDACQRSGLARPESPAQIVRVLLESLANRYAEVLNDLETITGRTIRIIHIVGGGSRNGLLNQLVANRTQRTVIAGPAEATAAGNILIQAMGAGLVSGLEEARAIVRASLESSVVTPR